MKKLLYLLLIPHVLMLSCTNSDSSRSGMEHKGEVIVYTSEDRIFSEPILNDFAATTGIKVKPVFDTEETKSTGIVNRLIAEKDNPRCDVFWSGDPVRAIILKNKGILAPYISPTAKGIPDQFKDKEGYWTGFSARVRVLMYNSQLVNPDDAPKSILDLTDPRWRGQIAIANPLFGTTSFHIAALFEVLGEENAKKFLRNLKANGCKIVSSNGEVRRQVASGQVKIGLNDSDDANVALLNKSPVAAIFLDQDASASANSPLLNDKDVLGNLIIPNTVSLIAGSPNPENGKRLIDYLLSPKVEVKLARAECAQIPLHPNVKTPSNVKTIESIRAMKIDYASTAKRLEAIQDFLKKWVGYNGF